MVTGNMNSILQLPEPISFSIFTVPKWTKDGVTTARSPSHKAAQTNQVALVGLGGLGLESRGCSVISVIHNVRNRGVGKEEGSGTAQ